MPHAKPFLQNNQNFGGRIQVIRLKNADPALYRLYQARLGWRPEFAFVVTLTDTRDRKQGPPVVPAFNPATGYKVDGSSYAGGSHGMVRTGAGQDALAGVLDFEDYGIEVGRSGSGFHAADREVAIVAFQSEDGMLVANLDDDEVKPFGVDSGPNAFKYPPPLGDALDWLFEPPEGFVTFTQKMQTWTYSDPIVTDAFENRWIPRAIHPTVPGAWQRDAGGSTTTSGTGPTTNNLLEFVYTETSGSTTADVLENNGRITMSTAAGAMGKEFLEKGVSRKMTFRCCLQGLFLDLSGVKAEGLAIQTRAADTDPWVTAHLIRGWAYSTGAYVEGDTLTDYGMEEFTVVADGGWRDVEVALPDTAKQLRLRPQIVIPPGQISYVHDICLRSTKLEYSVAD